MSVLFLIPLGATSIGGAMALGALFHYVAERRAASNSAAAERGGVASALDELERRERSLTDFCDRANAELDAKRAALETLTRRATEAASALGRVLDSFSTTFCDAPVRSTTASEPFRTLENELRADLRELSEPPLRRVARR